MKNVISKIGKGILYILYLIVFVLLVLEIVYRHQWIDFYKSEFQALNTEPVETKNKTVLIFGDSFSADPHGYVHNLRSARSDINFVNASLPGTCALQAEYVSGRRIKETAPDMVIFQVYVGNDLLDVKYPVNWSEVSIIRNVYWMLSKNFRCLPFINYRLGQTSVMLDPEQLDQLNPQKIGVFDPNLYSSRTKLYLKAEPNYLEQGLDVGDEYLLAFIKLLAAYEHIIESCSKDCKIVFLMIPHCVQVSDTYLSHYEEMGMEVRNKGALFNPEYPFLQKFKKNFPNAQFINPLAFFQQAEKKGIQIYFQNDPHLTSEGQTILSELLLEEIIETEGF